jgi:diguanylate cyclase (GGDEF)-like protein
MAVAFEPKRLMTMLLVGMAYYGGAWLGVHQTITPEGIAVLWLPNAILLSAFLLLPYRQWPFLGLAALVAEVGADFPAFPLWAALAFGMVNLFEVTLAALLIRHVVGAGFNFDRLRSGAYFLLFGPVISSALAGLAGAGIYVLLGRADTAYLTLWKLWWFGDALGLLLLTPFIVVAWRRLEHGLPRLRWHVVAELSLLWIVVIVLGAYVFEQGNPGDLEFFFRPVWLVPLGILAAVRLGVIGASATVMLIAALAVWHLVQGVHPYATSVPQYAVWLTQEYLVLIAVISIGLAILLREIDDHREALKKNERALEAYNEYLEERVIMRTLALEDANQALQQANQQLAAAAATDELTGISNRRHFRAEAQRELARLRQGGESAAMIMVDLDHFKTINDSYGHEAGDLVLRSVLEPMSQSMRPRDLFGRMGGEEFLILLSGVELVTAASIAERIRAAIEALGIEYHGQKIHVTASFGVAQWDGKSDLDEFIRCADETLYRAKKRGRNRVECHLEKC